jgi:3-phenylpropionate/cinnamic acid dioxygenase small subunit
MLVHTINNKGFPSKVNYDIIHRSNRLTLFFGQASYQSQNREEEEEEKLSEKDVKNKIKK